MKIDDIIRKCIEIPGISIQRSDFSTELLLKEKEGKGSMTFFPLFPGVTIAYIFVLRLGQHRIFVRIAP